MLNFCQQVLFFFLFGPCHLHLAIKYLWDQTNTIKRIKRTFAVIYTSFLSGALNELLSHMLGMRISQMCRGLATFLSTMVKQFMRTMKKKFDEGDLLLPHDNKNKSIATFEGQI